MADPREPLGRLAHEQRLAHEADRAAAEGRQRFNLPPWEERDDAQRELDMRIGHAVANYALTENAVTWGTSCTSCARTLDAAYAETIRREEAEAKLAAIADMCRGRSGVILSADNILAIIGTEERIAND